jgi:catechol 2,3-dioxygenase-like lactoylglutathione lyase family enzyme
MNLEKIDHLVLTVADVERSCHFYCDVLGMRRVTFGENRTALHFGEYKINLHPIDWDYYLKAGKPSAGSADLCFIVGEDVRALIISLQDLGVDVIEGPIERTGAIGDLVSIYVRDPDGNLIELANQTKDSKE